MKCARIRKVILQSDVSRLPGDVLDHTRQCPRCGQVLRQTRAVTRLVHLKVYEQPAPGASGRCLAELRDRIAILQSWGHQGAGAETGGSGLGWRFGFAAAFVALIGLHVITTSRLPAPQTFVGDTQSPDDNVFGHIVVEDMARRDSALDYLFASNRIDTLHRVSEPFYSFAAWER